LDNADAPIALAATAFDEPTLFQPVYGDTDGAAGEAHFLPDCVYGQRTFVKQHFQYEEI
jgi:hypothetical protein